MIPTLVKISNFLYICLLTFSETIIMTGILHQKKEMGPCAAVYQLLSEKRSICLHFIFGYVQPVTQNQ